MGTEYWEGLLEWVKSTLLKKFNNISEGDLDLINLVDSADQVLEILDAFYQESDLSPNF